MLDKFRGKRILMLQGPNGAFFRKVATRLTALDATVWKINLSPADAFFFPGPRATSYRGTFEDWPDFFARFAQEHAIDVVLLFGDCRPYHQTAIERAATMKLPVAVFEEGYLRPNYVTLEDGGVNGNSKLPRTPDFYRKLVPRQLPKARPVGNVLPAAAYATIANSLLCTLFGFRYPHYQHHRDVNTFRQMAYWARGLYRKWKYTRRDLPVTSQLLDGSIGPFFLVALQVHLDSQMRYCRFEGVEDFLRQVVSSFAEHAPKDCRLLVKHHPFDRPYRDYTRLLESLAKQWELGDRLVYVDVIPLPLALKLAKGTVVINSTVGLTSVQVGTPTKCLGEAVYDMEGLTHQGPLADFWNAPGSVDHELYARFRQYLRTENQLNGSVWTSLFDES